MVDSKCRVWAVSLLIRVNDDDIEIYSDESRQEILAVSNQMRQQLKKVAGAPNNCLADFIAPKETKIQDHIGAFVVTTGYKY